MENGKVTYIKSVEFFIIGFIFLILFTLPVMFTRVNGEIAWSYVFKIWKDQILLLPLFAINHWLLVPKLLLRKKYFIYLSSVMGFIALFSLSYYYQDEILNKKPKIRTDMKNQQPDPVPPYADLLMYSFLIVGVDSGLSLSKRWHENEEKRSRLETENAEMQLSALRNQLSPHFFMNTLNNIYALVDSNSLAAKEAVMKLSKLMRYMLYETENGKVKISKEFEFIRSYIDLMKLRFTDEMVVHLILPENFDDVEIPPMLFVSYIENAFKFGMSYENKSLISIIFEINDNKILFNCSNTQHFTSINKHSGGLGLKNSESRLKLLFGRNFALSTNSTEKMFHVSLVIPLS